ncbi:hypothetical protein [Aquipseudomonas alcaligenes]|uniref:hypothetical protein n=1 Tax=Aquipseudomonas alcaligenes TaxID=43263 RepID=UPI0012E89640|nr:hypothetical protein [Pseudomonas alcaligenes]
MSYTVDLIVSKLPSGNDEAWKHVEALRESYYNDKREKAPELLALHDVLTARYPCLCSYADDDPHMDESPWADGPMIGNFASEMGMLAISFSRVEEVFPFVVESANALGITVADGQTGDIHRPTGQPNAQSSKRPWWRLWQ